MGEVTRSRNALVTSSFDLSAGFPPEHDREIASSAWKQVALWIVGAAIARGLLSSFVPLLPDESYYWLWTRHLEAGYFDHPPGIAFLIKVGTLLLGDSHTGVRAGPFLAALITHGAAVLVAWQIAGRGASGAKAARRAAVLVAAIPLATLGLVLATPDAALFATVMLALLGVERALASPVRSWTSLAWWTVAGVLLGAAFVAKYTAVLLPAGLVVACCTHPALRKRFTEFGPWWASLLALAIFAPVVLWNYANDWISFRFQLGHGFGAAARGSVFTRELELVGAQVGLASPILFCLLAVAVYAALRDGWRTRHMAYATDASVRRFALAVISLVPLAFFAFSATRRPVEANWPALMYPSAMLLLATDTQRATVGQWWQRGVALAVALLLVVSVQAYKPVLPLAPRKDPIARAHGWSTLGSAVDRARHDAFLEGTVDRWVSADRYQDASELAFQLADHPTVFSLNLGGRPNQFDLWATAYEKVRPGDGMVAVFDDNPAGDSLGVRVGRWFKESRRGEQVVLMREQGAVAHRRIWLYRIATDVPPRARSLPSLTPRP